MKMYMNRWQPKFLKSDEKYYCTGGKKNSANIIQNQHKDREIHTHINKLLKTKVKKKSYNQAQGGKWHISIWEKND